MKKLSIAFATVVVLASSCQKSDRVSENPENVPPAPTEELAGRQCAADDVLKIQIAKDPARAARLQELEAFTAEYEANEQRFFAGTLYVPVVVHIVLPNPSQVTDNQILSQIDVLNKDFGKTNSELANSNVYLAGYSYNNVANVDVKFVVTQVIRKTAAGAFGTNDAVKKTSSGGSDPVNATTHMNFWVCDLSSGLLGYAQFPGGSSATDGVVVDYQAFGTDAATSYPMYSAFNLGRTATHEVGHWVNLRHIWGDARCGNDQVTDTPAHDASNGGCPATTHKSRCSGKPLEQWMNYMDYTDDACMYMFTNGQKLRMEAAIDGSRKPYFLTSAPASVL